jgi:hypothetical protein
MHHLFFFWFVVGPENLGGGGAGWVASVIEIGAVD